MHQLVKLTIAALAVLLCCARIEARATHTVSYLNDIDLSYNPQTGLWRCDRLTCPLNTRSCRITRQNMVNDPSFVVLSNYCYNMAEKVVGTLLYASNMATPAKVDIEINSFLGAVTDLVYGYSNSSQTVNGTVRWEDWGNVQRQYRGIILEVEKSQAQFNESVIAKK